MGEAPTLVAVFATGGDFHAKYRSGWPYLFLISRSITLRKAMLMPVVVALPIFLDGRNHVGVQTQRHRFLHGCGKNPKFACLVVEKTIARAPLPKPSVPRVYPRAGQTCSPRRTAPRSRACP